MLSGRRGASPEGGKKMNPQGFTFEDTAFRIAAKNVGFEYWAASDYRRFMYACRVAGLDPIAVIRQAEAVSA